jgi:hypothetical protein
MKWPLSSIQTLLAIITAVLAILGVLWKVIFPLIRGILGRVVVYAAQIAEVRPPPPDLIEFKIHEFMPFPRIPVYSDFSREPPNFPSRAGSDRAEGLKIMRETLTGVALEQARSWEATVPRGLSLLGDKSSLDMQLYQTWARLRWFLIEECHSDYSMIAAQIGPDCNEALKKLEKFRNDMVKQLPTRILVIRVANRGGTDAKELKIDITSGGEIYDVTVNQDLNDGKIERSSNRFMITWAVLQPGYVVEVRLWYIWSAVLFGSRTGSQSERFPGYEGIMINHIGISNGKVRRRASLLADLDAWKSIDIPVGPQLSRLPASASKRQSARRH